MIAKPKSKFHDEWFTPMDIINALGPFDLDPACGKLCPNKTAARLFGPKENGLKQPWKGRVWLNPPFTNAQPFALKMIEHGYGTMLIFAGSQARWVQDSIRAAGKLFIFRRNPHFGRPGKNMVTSLRQQIWLLPFGEQDHQALERAKFTGLLFEVKQ